MTKTILYLLNEYFTLLTLLPDNLGTDHSFSYHLGGFSNFFTIYISVLISKSKRAFERHFVHYTKSNQSVSNYVLLILMCSKHFSLQYVNKILINFEKMDCFIKLD